MINEFKASQKQESKDLILQLTPKTAFLTLSNYFCQLLINYKPKI